MSHKAFVPSGRDVTMYRDAVKTTGHENHLVVKDLFELIYKAM